MSTAKKLVIVGLAVLSVRLALLAGAGAAVGRYFEELFSGGNLISASISLELGARQTPPAKPDAPAVGEVISPLDFLSSAPPAPLPSPETSPDKILETTIYGALVIRNATDLEIDEEALLAEGPSLLLPAEGPQILIIHTHSSEAYTPEGLDRYTPTDKDRTEDVHYNVVRVGDELTASLESYGLSVLHDREIYDYPSYTGSYSRSGKAVEAHLAKNPSIRIVIDVHRDALGENGVVYKTMAEVDGETASQVMLLCGTNESGLTHPDWRENLKLALYLQNAVNKKYPTLARPVSLVNERYNQQLTHGSLILEVGSSGNTLREALCAVRLFASACGPALSELVEGK
ncbi:MAG: stage II sporulation protein P [Oscillospiraceae bacterium]